MTSEVMRVVDFMTPTAITVMGLQAVTAWVLLRSLRTRASRWLLAFTVANPAWILACTAVLHLAVYGQGQDSVAWHWYERLEWLPLAGFCMLALCTAVAFLVVAAQVSRRIPPAGESGS